MIPPLLRPARHRAALVATGLMFGLTAAACEGNGWTELPTGGRSGRSDASAPSVAFVTPDSASRVAVQDSVLVRVRVRDDVALDSVLLTGYSLRGSARLGTEVKVQRFAPKVVALRSSAGAVRDTILERFLIATSDSVAEQPVYLVATAVDTVGNARADTLLIGIGGPRVRIQDPVVPVEVRRGSQLRVRVTAADTVNRLLDLRVRVLNRSGAVADSVVVRFEPAVASVDTVVVLPVTAATPEQALIQAAVRNTINETALSTATELRALPAAADSRAPTVTFTVTTRARAEVEDSVFISVWATDSSRVDRVGTTVLATNLRDGGTDQLRTYFQRAPADSAGFRFALKDLGLVSPTELSTLRLEVIGFALDAAGNCGMATRPATPMSDACPARVRGDTVLAGRPTAQTPITLVRGATVSPSASTDRLVDLVVDAAGRRVFVTNFARNRLEVLRFGDRTFERSITVGSRPWGVAMGRSRDTLFVANSGGTNISVVPLAELRETDRIRTPDIQLYSIQYNVDKDSVSAINPHDYSDRPQFLGQLSGGQLIYSTVPTSVREPGTVRIRDPRKDVTVEFNRATEVFVGYASAAAGKAILVNALRVEPIGAGRMRVYPRRLRPADADPPFVQGTVTEVQSQLTALRRDSLTDTRLDKGVDIASVPLSDTTFVAVSGDNSTIAFGEGARDPGRILLFKFRAGQLEGSSTQTADLLGNAAERVISLGLNGDGSLGVARGRQAYFFGDDLRLQGVVASGSPSGGSTLHPGNRDYPAGSFRRAFVSGVDADGAPYIEVVDSYSFRSVRRVYIRDPVVGALVAAAVVPGDPESDRFVLRVFGITRGGVLQVGLTASDLR